MAENTTLNLGTGGDLIATDELTTLNGAAAAAGLKVQRVKVGFGTDNSLRDVDANNPFPTTVVDVTATGTLAAAAQTVVISMAGGLSAATVQISGTWVGTITFEGTVNGTDWSAINGVYAGTSFPSSTITANGLVRLTPAGLASMRVHMTAFTSGSATIAMRASDGVGGVFANQILPTRVTDGVSVQAIKPASTAAVAADPAAVVAISPNSTMPQPDVNTTGTITTTDLVVAAPAGAGALVTGASTAGSFVFAAITGGYTAWVAQITGLTAGTIHFEGSVDSTTGSDGNWINLIGRQIGILNSLLTGNATGNGNWRGNLSSYRFFRLRSVGTLTGTPAIVIRMSAGVATVFLNGSLPAGTNTIGAVNIADQRASTLHVSQTGAVNTAVTASLPAPAAGLFHYITSIQVVKVYNVLGVAAGAGVVVTSTNLPGTPNWTTEEAAGAVGTAPLVIDYQPTTPLRSAVAATISTVACPAQLQTIWRINVSYFTAA